MHIRTLFLFFLAISWKAPAQVAVNQKNFVTCITVPGKVHLYWKDESGQPLKTLAALKAYIERCGLQLIFATNGGMYEKGNVPKGLYIQDGKTLVQVDKGNGSGNFYMKPNGIFYITKLGKAGIIDTKDYVPGSDIWYATQSGPLLLYHGVIHPAFKKGSEYLNIRNGVGILPGNKLVFVMSRLEVSLYDFALYFKQLGCYDALYLDGFVSRTYFPAADFIQSDGDFGVMIAVLNR